jgi:hypothetical protein
MLEVYSEAPSRNDIYVIRYAENNENGIGIVCLWHIQEVERKS